MNAIVPPPGSDNFTCRILEIRIGGRYQLDRKLGSGTFGKVYKGRDVETGDDVALKLEHDSIGFSLVAEEAIIYESLAAKPGFPRLLWHGQHDSFNIMALDLLGPNLEDLLCYCGGKFSLKTTLMLADQLLARFQTLHAHDYIHRDVKPENFLMGVRRQGNTVYMTDLGLAAFRPKRESEWRRRTRERRTNLVGTCRYASINGHYDGAQTRADDLESLGYMLIYFIKGRLPWQGLHAETREEKDDKVRQMKETTSVEDLCTGLPPAFETYMNYLRSLPDSDSPDYQRLRRNFCSLFKKEGFSYDNVFDWTILEYERLLEERAARSEEANTTTRGRQRGRGVNGEATAKPAQKRAKPVR